MDGVFASQYSMLGAHNIDGEWMDAIDTLIRLTDGRVVVFGLRTVGYLSGRETGDPERWGAYVPLPVTLDLATVRHWDFNEILWLGPDPWHCLVWSNAEAFNERALHTIFHRDNPGGILRGPTGVGLPTPADLGLELSDDPVWVPLAISRAQIGPQP